MNGAKTTIDKAIETKEDNCSKNKANGMLTRIPDAKKKANSFLVGL